MRRKRGFRHDKDPAEAGSLQDMNVKSEVRSVSGRSGPGANRLTERIPDIPCRRAVDESFQDSPISLPEAVFVESIQGVMRAGGLKAAGNKVLGYWGAERLIGVDCPDFGAEGPAGPEQQHKREGQDQPDNSFSWNSPYCHLSAKSETKGSRTF